MSYINLVFVATEISSRLWGIAYGKYAWSKLSQKSLMETINWQNN